MNPAGWLSSIPMSESSTRHPLARALLILTFTTGVVDAVSYLGLGHVFTANMTGNIVLLGFGIAGSGGLPVISPLVSLGAFLLGAVIGGRRVTGLARGKPEHLARALAIEVAMVGLAALLALAIDVRPNQFSGDLVIALLALGMGVRNATVRRIGVADLTTTVLTMTLTGLAADSPPAHGSGAGSARRVLAVLAMLTGAIAGALLLNASLALPLAAAAVLAALTWVVYVPAARRLPSNADPRV